MEQLIILVLIGLISLINWIIQKSAEMREKRKLERMRDHGLEPPEVPTTEPEPAQGADEAMRRLMEALGLPEDAAPPPPRPQPPFIPPPLPEPPRTPVPVARTASEPSAAFMRRKAREMEAALAAASAKPGRVRGLLTAPGGARDAIVLSEVLGPPKAMR